MGPYKLTDEISCSIGNRQRGGRRWKGPERIHDNWGGDRCSKGKEKRRKIAEN